MTTDYEKMTTHTWIRGNELPLCSKCGMSPISAHLWGDSEWIKHAIVCGDNPSLSAIALRKERNYRDIKKDV